VGFLDDLEMQSALGDMEREADTAGEKRTIRHVDIGLHDCYVQYDDMDSEYLSFAETKKAIFATLPKRIGVECAESDEAVKLLNSLLRKYTHERDELVAIHVPISEDRGVQKMLKFNKKDMEDYHRHKRRIRGKSGGGAN